MKEYVGYGVPPNHSKFKVGNREHLKRRKKRAPDLLDEIRMFLTEVVTYRIGGKNQRGRRIDVLLLKLKNGALNGDLNAAASLLDLREHPGDFAKFKKTILIFEEEDAFC